MKKALVIFCVVLFAGLATARGVLAETAGVRIVVLGDSLVAGYDLPQTDAFPSQLERMLLDRGHQVEVINAGVSGDTSTGALSRLKWAVPDDTDMVIVELGANDALRGVPPENTKASLHKIITTLKAQGMQVLLAGMRAPPNMGQEYEAEFNVIYDELAEELEVLLYPFFLEGVAANPNLNLSDGIHPNAEGVAEIVRRIRPMVEAMVIELAANGES